LELLLGTKKYRDNFYRNDRNAAIGEQDRDHRLDIIESEQRNLRRTLNEMRRILEALEQNAAVPQTPPANEHHQVKI